MMEHVYLGFRLDDKIFGIEAQNILRVSQIVEITSIPQAADTVLGIINVMGEVVPVVDLRKLLGLPPRTISLSDYLIIVKNKQQALSIVADEIIGLIPAFNENNVSLKNIIQNTVLIERVIRQDEDFILIIDSQKLLEAQESQNIQKMVEAQNDTLFTTFRKATA